MHPLLSTILTFVLTFATLKVAVDAVDLSIKPSGEEFTKAVGMSMVLTCEVVGVQPGGPHKVEWRDKEGKPISENIRQRVYTEKEDAGTKLYITNIEHKDAGRYTCHLVGTPTKLFKGIRLAIFKDITFDNAPSPQNPKIFSDAIIHCRVSAEPRPEVSWRFKNRKIEPDMRYSMDVNGLRIKNVTRADDGEYTCRAEVKAEGRYDERRITVAIHIPPTIKKHLESQEGVQGSSIQISCQGDGFPTPKYEFRKNGNSNWLPADHSRIIIDGDVGRIEFKPLRKEDEGEYTCIAINDVGEDRSQAKIAVLVQPEIYELRNLSKTEGESATLVCKSHGDPSPSMTFRKIGSSHDFNSTNVDRNRLQLRYSVGKLELEFKKVNASDTGNYSCTSQNKAGHTSAVGSVVVNYKPRFSHDHVRKVYIWAGKTHNISCHVHAHPLPDIHWLRHGRELQNNDTYQIFTMSSHSFLQVRVKESDQSWIYGNYTCRARNHLGEQRIDIEMAQATIPSAPLSVSVKEVSPNMVILDVVPPRQNGGKEVIGYRIEYGHRLMDFAIGYKESRAELTSTPSTRPSASPSKEELVVENLRPSTNYTFLIRAKNEVGVGHAVQQTVATLPVRTPYPVRIVSPRTGREAFSYTLVWDTPKTGGKPIQKYIIKYRQVDPVSGTKTSSGAVARDDWHSTITISDSMHEPRVEYVLEGLTPMTHYEVEIIAQTNLGTSLPTKFVFSTSEVPPRKSGVGSGASAIMHQRALPPLLSGCIAAVIIMATIGIFSRQRR
jgi:neurocan core protein